MFGQCLLLLQFLDYFFSRDEVGQAHCLGFHEAPLDHKGQAVPSDCGNAVDDDHGTFMNAACNVAVPEQSRTRSDAAMAAMLSKLATTVPAKPFLATSVSICFW